MFKNFKVNIILRLLLLIALISALMYCLFFTVFYIAILVLTVLIIWSFINLVNYVDRSNQDVAHFLAGIKYDDFSINYSPTDKGNSFSNLYKSFNHVTQKFQELSAEKEANHHYLQNIVEHVNVGLICIDGDNNVVLYNNAAKEILRKPHLINEASLEKIDKNLYNTVSELGTGQKQLIKVTIKNQIIQLAIQTVIFKLQNKQYKLVSLQNIQQELEGKEFEAWQKLIRILTHEIMNSVTPIASLTSSINELLSDKEEVTPTELSDIKAAIDAIQKRSEGLLHFTETYRNLTRIPPPKFQLVDGRTMMERIHTLFKPLFKKKGITFNIFLPHTDLYFTADVELLEQVLINLIKNAIDAVKDQANPTISINAKKTLEQRTVIQVGDNGKGIEAEVLDQIFIPFFTTKKEGSGIGLPLSRQIMRMHKGNISVQSTPNEGTLFTLSL